MNFQRNSIACCLTNNNDNLEVEAVLVRQTEETEVRLRQDPTSVGTTGNLAKKAGSVNHLVDTKVPPTSHKHND